MWSCDVDTDDISPYPTVVMVTTAHQKPSGMDLKWEAGEPASAKYTVLLNNTTPVHQTKKMIKWTLYSFSLLIEKFLHKMHNQFS